MKNLKDVTGEDIARSYSKLYPGELLKPGTKDNSHFSKMFKDRLDSIIKAVEKNDVKKFSNYARTNKKTYYGKVTLAIISLFDKKMPKTNPALFNLFKDLI